MQHSNAQKATNLPEGRFPLWLFNTLKKSFLLCCFILCTQAVKAQITISWTGNVNSDWSNPSNWIPNIVPSGTSYRAFIQNTFNDPVIDESVLLNNIIISDGARLVVDTDGTLTCTGGGGAAVIAVFINQGSVENYGIIEIGSGSLNVQYGLYSDHEFYNYPGSYLEIGSSKGGGIFSVGSFINEGGEIAIGNQGDIEGVGIIVEGGQFTNRAFTLGVVQDGIINIDNTDDDAVCVNSGGTFSQGNDSARLFIGANSTIPGNGIKVFGFFFARGTVEVFSSTSPAINVTNEGNIRILSGAVYLGTNTSLVSGVRNEGLFQNYSTLEIRRAGFSGIFNFSTGAFYNYNGAAILIGTSSLANFNGLSNQGYFSNAGTLDIKEAGDHGIRNASGADFINRPTGTITIGSNDLVGENGILNENTFTNQGTINIQRTLNYGFENINNASFQNTSSGNLNVGISGGSIGEMGIFSKNSSFTNDGGTIRVDYTGQVVNPSDGWGIGIEGSGSFENLNGGLIEIGQTGGGVKVNGLACVESASFTNSGSTIRIDNSTGIGLAVQSGSSFNNVLSSIIELGQGDGNIEGRGVQLTGGSDFTNNASTILIDKTLQTGFFIAASTNTFQNLNNGLIEIGQAGGTNSIGLIGLDNQGIFLNNNARIIIDNTSDLGLRNAFTATFTNTNGSKIFIGQNGGSGNIDNNGLLNSGNFLNTGSNTDLEIDNTFFSGIFNGSVGTFTNTDADIRIGQNGMGNAIGYHGVFNSGTFTNTSGEIEIANVVGACLETANGSFTNRGFLKLGNSEFSDAILANNYPLDISFDNALGALQIFGDALDLPILEGIVLPGNSPGVLNFNTDVDLFSAILGIEVDGPTAITEHDVITVNGTAIIGGELYIDINYLPVDNDRIVFLTATSIIGTFSFVDPTIPEFWTIDYSVPGEVALQYFPVSLPVELLDFQANKNEDQVILDWQTATESNNEGFMIMHSMDARNWTDIGFVAGNGDSQELLSYSFTHTQPLPGNNYYHLRQMDFDGKVSTSEVEVVHFEEISDASMINISPNPTADRAMINLPTTHAAGRVVVHDQQGRTVFEAMIDLDQLQVELDLLAFSAGVYVVSIQMGSTTITEQLIKTNL